MPINGAELLNAAEIIAQNRNIMVSVKGSAAGSVVVGLTAFGGGLLLGPIGLLAGGVTGGLLGYAATKDRFKPLHEVIAKDLTPREQIQLVEHLKDALKDFDITDVVKLAQIVMSSGPLQAIVADAVVSFAQNNLNRSVKY